MKDLIIKVNNNNDYTDQDVEYFRIERTPEIIAGYSKRLESIQVMAADDSTFYKVNYWDGFEVLTGCFADVIGDVDAVFYELTKEEEELYISDARITTHIFSLQLDGEMGWVANGKHCGTEFWAHDMPFDAFKKGEFDKEEEESS